METATVERKKERKGEEDKRRQRETSSAALGGLFRRRNEASFQKAELKNQGAREEARGRKRKTKRRRKNRRRRRGKGGRKAREARAAGGRAVEGGELGRGEEEEENRETEESKRQGRPPPHSLSLALLSQLEKRVKPVGPGVATASNFSFSTLSAGAYKTRREKFALFTTRFFFSSLPAVLPFAVSSRLRCVVLLFFPSFPAPARRLPATPSSFPLRDSMLASMFRALALRASFLGPGNAANWRRETGLPHHSTAGFFPKGRGSLHADWNASSRPLPAAPWPRKHVDTINEHLSYLFLLFFAEERGAERRAREGRRRFGFACGESKKRASSLALSQCPRG